MFQWWSGISNGDNEVLKCSLRFCVTVSEYGIFILALFLFTKGEQELDAQVDFLDKIN